MLTMILAIAASGIVLLDQDTILTISKIIGLFLGLFFLILLEFVFFKTLDKKV